MLSGTLAPGYALDDGVGLLFEDDRSPQAVSARPRAGARRVWMDSSRLYEESLQTRLLAPVEPTTTAEASIVELRELRAMRRAG